MSGDLRIPVKQLFVVQESAMSFAVSLRDPSLLSMWLLSKSNFLKSFTSLHAFRVPPDEANRAKCCFNAAIHFVLPSLSLVQCLA